MNVVTLGATFGKEYESSIEWTYKSKECEYCHPEICFPHSSVTVWDTKSTLFKRRLKWIETDFRQGTVAEISNNCAQNVKQCNCVKSESSDISGEGGKMENLETSSQAVVMTPYDYDSQSKTGGQIRYGSLTDEYIESSFFNSELNAQNNELGVLNPSGYINWIYPRLSAKQEISLLLRKPTDYLGTNLRTLQDGIFPVIAMTQELRKSTIEGSITLEDSRDSSVKEPNTTEIHPMPVETNRRTDFLTAFYLEFDLSNKLKNNDRMQLKLKLRDKDGTMKGHLVENFVIRQREFDKSNFKS